MGEALLVTVHGTFDASPGGGDRKWWEENSDFVGRVCSAVSTEYGRALRHEVFPWSGLNVESERRAAALRLADTLETESLRKSRIVVLAHSHGGNVVRGALGELSKRAADKRVTPCPIDVVTIGTPFFRYKWYPEERRWRPFGLAAALTLIAIAAAYQIVSSTDLLTVFGTQTETWWTIFAMGATLLGGTLIGVIVAVYVEFQEDDSTVRRRRPALDVRWSAVHSANDEAMVALSYLSKARPLFRAIARQRKDWNRLGAATKVAIGLLATASAAIMMYRFVWARFHLPADVLPSNDDMRSVVDTVLILIAIAFTLAIWITVNRVFRLVVSAILAIIRKLTAAGARVLAERADELVVKRLADWAYGNDSSPKVSGVHPLPWDDFGVPDPLRGALHDELERHVVESYPHTMARIRLILTERDTDSDRSYSAIMSALTWDEIAHTAYFKSEAIATHLVRHIVGFLGEMASSDAPAELRDTDSAAA